MKGYYRILIWLFVIAYLCFAPADDFGKVDIMIPHFDKVVHFIMFLILGILLESVSAIPTASVLAT